NKLPGGLDYPIQEGGLGLSGGQRQALLLARLLLRQPRVLLLDEPTASFDEVAEKRFIQRLGPWLQGRTLIVATHRQSILSLVDRIIVVDNGRILRDGSKQQILGRLAPAGAAQPGASAGSQARRKCSTGRAAARQPYPWPVLPVMMPASTSMMPRSMHGVWAAPCGSPGFPRWRLPRCWSGPTLPRWSGCPPAMVISCPSPGSR